MEYYLKYKECFLHIFISFELGIADVLLTLMQNNSSKVFKHVVHIENLCVCD